MTFFLRHIWWVYPPQLSHQELLSDKVGAPCDSKIRLKTYIRPTISLHQTQGKFLPVICNCERTRTNRGQAYGGRVASTPFTNVARSRVLSVSTIAAIPARPSTFGTCNHNFQTLHTSLFATSNMLR